MCVVAQLRIFRTSPWMSRDHHLESLRVFYFMEGKKSFTAYCDWINVFEKLTDEEAGRVIKHLFKYVNDQNPKPIDRITELVFEPIKLTLKRDLVKWIDKSGDKSIAGIMGNLKRYNVDLYHKVKSEEITIEQAQSIAKHRKASQRENNVAELAVRVRDSVRVSDSEKEIDIKPTAKFSFFHSLTKLTDNKQLINDWLKVRKNKRATNSETAYNMFINQVDKTNLSIDEVLKICIEKDWKSFKSEWVKDEKPKPTQSIDLTSGYL